MVSLDKLKTLNERQIISIRKDIKMKDIELGISGYKGREIDGRGGEYMVEFWEGYNRVAYVSTNNQSRIAIYRHDAMCHISQGEFLDAATAVHILGVDKFAKAIVRGNKIVLIKKVAYIPPLNTCSLEIIKQSEVADVPKHLLLGALAVKDSCGYYVGTFELPGTTSHGLDVSKYNLWRVIEPTTRYITYITTDSSGTIYKRTGA